MNWLSVLEVGPSSHLKAHEHSAIRMPLGGFAVAIIGAYIAFLPLLQILLPLEADRIAPHHAAALLGTVAAIGAVMAGIANFLVGWLSDRTKSRFGRRRPWILAGLLGIAASYAAIWLAQTIFTFIIAFALFQVMFNVLFSPLMALVSDRVTADRRGLTSAVMGLGKPVGTIVGTIVIGTLLTRESDRFMVLGLMVFGTVLPFVCKLGPDPAFMLVSEVTVNGDPACKRTSRNFILAWFSRVCIIMAFTVAQLYLLFYLQAIMPDATPRRVQTVLTVLAIVFGIVSATFGFITGRISDRTGRRRTMLIGSAVTISVAMAALAVAPSWPLAVAAYALFAIGAGVHTAIEFAMVIDILPSRDRAARDLGILNVSNIVPQIVAPLAITWMLAIPGSTIQWAFAAAAVAAAGGAAFIAFMRAVQ